MEPLLSIVPDLLANLGLALGAVLGLWLISIPLRDVSIIDMVFGVIMTAIVLLSWHSGSSAEPGRSLLPGLVVLWALRMTTHLVQRNWGHGEDPRYSKLRGWVEGEWVFHWLSLRKVFLLQGVVLWLATLPAQVFLLLPGPAPLPWLVLPGALIAAFGLVYETVADRQLKAFRRREELRGTVLQSGLWRFSRHPNYFGELCFWWGIFLLACAQPLAFVTVVGPLAYSYLIVNITGQATLDKKLAREKPGYAEYMARTNGMIPWWPKPADQAPSRKPG
jgi:steroid 5-alpha reductase family enzyme